LSWRLDNRRRFILLLLAVVALVMQAVLDHTRTPTRQWDFDLKLEAATRAERAFAAVREHRGLEGASLDMVNDPAGTGLIGPEISMITNATGDLDAKLTSLNPNFAAVLVQYFRQAGLSPGDPVAAAVSGSFPGMNICLYAAMEAMELRPVVITSVGASNWGANSPEFTWLDMETLFFEKGIFHTRSQAATFGGGNDMGRGMSPAGRRLLLEGIERNGIPFLESDNIEDAIDKRMALYQDLSQGRAFRLFVNVGGGVASVGNRHTKTLLPEGLSFNLKAHNWPRKGTLILFADKGVPVVHLLRIINLARAHGLPLAPDFQPQPGQGEIFVKEMYRWPVAAAFLVVYCLACILILAPEIRRGLFDRLGRRPAVAPVFVLVAAGFFLPATVSAADQWRKMIPTRDHPEICLNSDGQSFTYLVLDSDDPVEFQVNGPRRVKLISRYAFGVGDPESQPFYISISLDGTEILRKSFTALANETIVCCDREGDVSSLRRAYVDVPKGSHFMRVTGQASGSGNVLGRLFRQNKRQTSGTVPYAPVGFAELATLQFESGTQSTYYRFEAGSPLTFAVTGPTNLQLYTRLDFEPGMLGSQKHMLEVWRDGAVWRTFHYDSTRLANAFYPDRLDILPGTRKKLRISVPDGLHQFEIRCVRPENCGITAQIRIPRKDLRGSP
jgi:poly-gamma-glutamate system protein